VRRKEDQTEYALKKVDLNDLSNKEKNNALNEVRLLASIQHENIVGYKDCFIEEETKMLW
jgi:NIMA (never in mitosis gene a)-related kinase